MKAILGALSLIVILAGCSMHQSIVLNPDGSGSADVQVALGPLVVQYMNDILGSLGSEPTDPASGPPLFDLGQIRSAFDAVPDVKLVDLSAPSRSTLRLRLAFSDINA
ncbi:MAG TPA: hypothetical protein VMW69_11950, partial [Spirochaetia bacterium]|nr:hypothetical protein [Spirochaetia bacterium]